MIVDHVHEDLQLVDIPFSRQMRNELVAAGRAMPHHIYPKSSMVTLTVVGQASLAEAIALFRLSYERLVAIYSPDQAGGAV